MITTLIIDNEPHARDDLENKVASDSAFKIIGKWVNTFEAIRSINMKCPDVIFFDIKIQKISGVEMLSMLNKKNMPRIVFVTDYGEHTIDAFKKNAIDFLLKPVKIDRLLVALERLKKYCRSKIGIKENRIKKIQFIPCYKGNSDYLISINDVCYVFFSPTTHIITKEQKE